MNIPDAAVEAAAKAYYATASEVWDMTDEDDRRAELNDFRAALEAAAPHMLAEVERELTEAKRVIALLVLESGGEVSLSRRALTELSYDTVIETEQDVINGGLVIRAQSRTSARG